ncbi:hypothetical protein [Paenibacillus agricola]|uniref:Uncharacterized protein n=1 Tax=Paenibacillus agricola TaxID=2716264 RepID=A0ABX0JEA9_9BACL|nr:hypothetical protein [Paenibacillus agricola]NHN34867.1 hypothetical protein [Paenibacillus agricola]
MGWMFEVGEGTAHVLARVAQRLEAEEAYTGTAVVVRQGAVGGQWKILCIHVSRAM